MVEDRLREESEYEALEKEIRESTGIHNDFKSDRKVVKKDIKHSERIGALRKEVDELQVYRTTNKLEGKVEIEVLKKQISLLRQIKRLG